MRYSGRLRVPRWVVHVSDQVDKLSPVVDAFLLRDRLLLFPLPMQEGEDQGADDAAKDRHQSQDSHQDHVEAETTVGRVGHGAFGGAAEVRKC